MLRKMDSLIGYGIEATDGEIGEVTDFYFDDQNWIMVYLILKTGHWLSGRKVLISSYWLQRGMGRPGCFPVNRTRAQIANSPDIDTDKPVSLQQEVELYGHYTWEDSWGSGFYAGDFVQCRHVKEVQWETEKIVLDVTSQVVKDSPAYDEAGFA
jgi:hypothetical protein